MGQPGGLNQFIDVPVPPSNGDGPVLDVSGLVAEKTFYLSGDFDGIYTILGSEDGTKFTPILSFTGGQGPRTIRSDIACTLSTIKVRRQALSPAIISLAAQETNTVSPNQFLPLPIIGSGASGPQPSIDTFALAPPNGLDKDLTIMLAGGKFVGEISIQGSIDDENWSGVAQFVVDSDVPVALNLEAVKRNNAAVRYFRAVVSANVSEDVSIFVAAELNAASGGGGGTAEFVEESVFNNTGSTIEIGEVLRIQGPADNEVNRAQAIGGSLISPTIAVALENIPDGANGRAATSGKVPVRIQSDIPAIGVGDQVWLSQSEPGRATPNNPENPTLMLGIVKEISGFSQPDSPTVTIDLGIRSETYQTPVGTRVNIAGGGISPEDIVGIAIGGGNINLPGAGSRHAIAIGNASVTGNRGICIGTFATGQSTSNGGVSIGQNCDAGTVAIGINVDASDGGIGIGSTVETTGTGIGIGFSVEVGGNSCVAIGNSPEAGTVGAGTDCVSIGTTTIAERSAGPLLQTSVAIGRGANATDGITIGSASVAVDRAIALGNRLGGTGGTLGARALALSSMAFGPSAEVGATHDTSIAIGARSRTTKAKQCVIGNAFAAHTENDINEFWVRAFTSPLGNVPADPFMAISDPTAAAGGIGFTGLFCQANSGAVPIFKQIKLDLGAGPGGGHVLFVDP